MTEKPEVPMIPGRKYRVTRNWHECEWTLVDDGPFVAAFVDKGIAWRTDGGTHLPIGAPWDEEVETFGLELIPAESSDLAATVARLEAEKAEILDALKMLFADVAGGRKACGHNFSCICAGDTARAILAKHN